MRYIVIPSAVWILSLISEDNHCTSVLYCATTALDGYHSHLDRIHIIWMVTSFYICGTTFYKLWQLSLLSLSHLPSILYFWPIFASIQAEPHYQLIQNTLIYHICASKDPSPILLFLSFQRLGVECSGK